MADRLEELALFPLNTVVFPYEKVQIHIFEERYREMVRKCLQQDAGFGIVLIRSGSEVGGPSEPYMVGTACRIEKVQTYDDGKMDIVIQGQRRFRIRKMDQSLPYLVAQVEPVVEMETEESPRAAILITRIRETVTRLIEASLDQADLKVASVKLPDDVTALSFRVANLLRCENIKKQYLLETTDTLERIEEMLGILEQQISDFGIAEESVPFRKLSVLQALEWISPN